uniref:Ribosome biogenesis protein BRX1 homolog n=1 Tax=Strigamia maritima TaxID=126957 RepID=T1JIK2_STRMM
MAPKRRHVEVEPVEIVESTRKSDDPPPKKVRWINRQRVLVFAARGITYRARHLMNNIRTLLPHSKSDTKMEKKDSLSAINQICQMAHCNKCIYFETRKKKDMMSNISQGPSVKFLVENVHTMEELKLTGNCLKGSRVVLSFDKNFEKIPHLVLLKELLVQIFGTPHHHPKSQPFIDHIFTFSVLDQRIWFRNYQIADEDGSLAEIGPRFVLNPICIFDGSFFGQKIWENPHYVSPNKVTFQKTIHRRLVKNAASHKYKNRVISKVIREKREPHDDTYDLDPTEMVFQETSEGKVQVKKKRMLPKKN